MGGKYSDDDVDSDAWIGLELEVFAGLGLYPTYVVMQGFSVSNSVILLSILNVSVIIRFELITQTGTRLMFNSQFLDDWPPHNRLHRRQIRSHQHTDGTHLPWGPRHLHHLASLWPYPTRSIRLQLCFRTRIRIVPEPRTSVHWTDLESQRSRRSVWYLLFHCELGVSIEP